MSKKLQLLKRSLIELVSKFKPQNIKTVLFLMFTLAVFSSYSQTIIDIPVVTSAADLGDDAEEYTISGTVNLTSSDLELCTEAEDQFVGIRFQNVTVPPGATITNAYIQFKVDETNSTAVTINIVGIDVDNAVQFTGANLDISNRINGTTSSSTTATATWSPPSWPTVGDQGVDQRTSDIKTIVKEIVDRGGWVSGNSMSFVFTKASGSGKRTAEDGDNAGDSPILHIEYTPLPGPDINLIGNGISIVNGDSTPNNIDDTYFESTTIASTITKTYTIENNGTTTLNVTSIVSDNVEFTVTAALPFAIAAGSSTTFTTTYNATVEGRSTGNITLTSDSIINGTYTFSVLGEISTAQNFNANGHWRYLSDGSDQGTAWQTTAFDDSSWNSGDAEIGYGDGDETTDLGQPATPRPITTYFRKKINITAADVANTTLKLNAIRDDGMVVYINGTEVWRSNITGVVDFTTLADAAIANGDESTWINSSISNPFATPGVYEIAVEIHQISNTSSDISFNFSLTMSNNLLLAGGVWSYLDDGSDQGTAWYATAFDYSSWATGNAEFGYGEGDEATVVSYGSDVNNKYITTYFRKQITAIGSDITNSTLVINALRDDGIIVYVNGVEVLRNNMPTGTITYTTTAFGDVTNLSGNDFETWWNVYKVANTLVSGANEIAVEIHQYSNISSDLSFNLSLETNNDLIIVPSIKPDNDTDGVEDYVDADDDNDGLPDLMEGCYTTNVESLYPGVETSLLPSLPITTALDDGNNITYSVNNTSNFKDITSYDAGQHGFGLRVKGPVSTGILTLEFDTAVDNLFFKLIDFDEGELFKIDAYDSFGNIVDLTTEEGIYHLGSYIEYLGNNTIHDIYNTTAPNTNNSPEKRSDDIYGTAYFYFPSVFIKKVVFTIDYSTGGTIRIAGVQFCSKDTDGDGVDDFYDSDSDNDGIPDIVEIGAIDTNGDGKVDNFLDNDGDGVASLYDTDDNFYFIEEPSTLTDLDFDGDGVPNRLDLDSDNDGIVDLREIEQPDVDFNGQIDNFIDADSDGYNDAFDGVGSQLITGGDGTVIDGLAEDYPNANKDLIGNPNYLDIDSDNDGITDNTEAQATNPTLFISYTFNTNEGDGILTVFDDNTGSFGGKGLIPVDSDGDGTPDYLDTDSDNDGGLDVVEGHDTNGDDIVDASDISCLTSLTSNYGKILNTDTDNDGLDDGFDNDLTNFDPSNVNLEPTSHPNIDDIASLERDWREPEQLYNQINFDGVNDYIDFADKHNFNGSFTIETWVKQDALSTGNGMIVSKRDCNKGKNIGYNLGLTNHFPTVIWYDDFENILGTATSSDAIGADRWYYVSTVYDSATSTVKIYIDGVEVASNSGASDPVTSTESFLIGAKFDDQDASHKLSDKFYGYIDEVRIWDKALSAEQLRAIMNQEIEQNGTAVRGKTIPIDVPGLLWTDLLGYYPMNAISNGKLIDQSSFLSNGSIRNITTTEAQTAPLPYTTKADGAWDSTSIWTYGDSVWSVPNTVGVDGATVVDWNIVEISHNITSGNRAVKVEGLVSNAGKITMEGVTGSDGVAIGYSLEVTNYLLLNGEIKLQGESQLIQPEGSILDNASSGSLERDQQGTANSYNYNYWSSSVGPITASGSPLGNPSINLGYKLNDNLLDGTNSATPQAVNFQADYTAADSGVTNPIIISTYWLYKFYGTDDDYDAWISMDENTSLLPGEGYTMKGTSGATTVGTVFQNYTFKGKPYNGDITLPLDKLSGEVDRLIGNPYPSAIDATIFIKDNLSTANGGTNPSGNIFNGALYFWDHFGEENTHNLGEYVGGYATRNLTASAPAVSNDVRINNDGSLGTKTPGQYIPVGQGFFVITAIDAALTGIASVSGGNIVFKNSQRAFQLESLTTGSSVFLKANGEKDTAVKSTTDTAVDTRPKIRLMYDSPTGYHRQIVIGIDENTTNDFDIGYDAPMADINTEDMYWLIQNVEFVIQGVNNFNIDQEFPIGIIVSETGLARIKIDSLENLESAITPLFIKDNLTGESFQINDAPFEITLDPGEYSDRFSLTFDTQDALAIEDEVLEEGVSVFMNNTTGELQINNNIQVEFISVRLYNSLGQLLHTWNKNLEDDFITLPIDNKSTGVYIVQINTTKGMVSKKIIIQ